MEVVSYVALPSKESEGLLGYHIVASFLIQELHLPLKLIYILLDERLSRRIKRNLRQT